MTITSLHELAHIPLWDIDYSIFIDLWGIATFMASSEYGLVPGDNDRHRVVSASISLIRACKEQPVDVECINSLIDVIEAIPMYGRPILSRAAYMLKPLIGDRANDFVMNPRDISLFISDIRSGMNTPIGVNEALSPLMLHANSPSQRGATFAETLVVRHDLERLYATIMPNGERMASPPIDLLSRISTSVCGFVGIHMHDVGVFSYSPFPIPTSRLLIECVGACLENKETPWQRLLVSEIIILYMCASVDAPLSIEHARLARKAFAYARALAITFIARVIATECHPTNICDAYAGKECVKFFSSAPPPLVAYPPPGQVNAQLRLELLIRRVDLHKFISTHEPIRVFLVNFIREVKKEL